MSEQRLTRRTRFKNWLRKMIALVLNPRFLLCFFIAWLITNGWAYIMLGFGIWREIEWMSTVAGAYLAFLMDSHHTRKNCDNSYCHRAAASFFSQMTKKPWVCCVNGIPMPRTSGKA